MSDVEKAKALFLSALDLLDARDYAAGEVKLRAALALAPERVSVLTNLAAALFRQDKLVEACEVATRSVALDPNKVEGWLVLGSALNKRRLFDEALVAMESAVGAAPTSAAALMGRASVLTQLGHLGRAVADYQAAWRINPDEEDLRGLLVTARMQACDWTGLEDDTAALLADIRAGRTLVDPFSLLAMPSTPEDQLRCASAMVARDYPAMAPLYRGERYDHRRIRVAYVSGDYHRHPTTYLVVAALEQHDRDRFETFGISLGPDDKSEERTRVSRAFDRFIDARERGNGEIAALLYANQVDIAIDLGGFTSGGRLSVFAMRPAPVQAAYLGYPGTTGAPYIDYLIADAVVVPPDAYRFYSEKIVALPGTYQANDNRRPRSQPIPTRAECGLPPTGFVFCSFSNNYKIAPAIFAVWMELLTAVEGSVLWLMGSNQTAADNLRREAVRGGIAGERLIFASSLPVDQHLARHRLADLCLDTLPYNAHTTASDALWMGTPIITCPGSTFPSRVAASLLTAIGLPELITKSLDQYRQLALTLAREPARLAAIRAKLAANRDTTALFDTARFTRHLEAAYVTMIERYRRGEAPAAFSVEPVS